MLRGDRSLRDGDGQIRLFAQQPPAARIRGPTGNGFEGLKLAREHSEVAFGAVPKLIECFTEQGLEARTTGDHTEPALEGRMLIEGEWAAPVVAPQASMHAPTNANRIVFAPSAKFILSGAMLKPMSSSYSATSSDVLDRLLTSHRGFLAFLERRLPDRATAEEVLQTAFVKTLDRGATVADPERSIAWFYRLLRNALADYYRQTWRLRLPTGLRSSRLARTTSRSPPWQRPTSGLPLPTELSACDVCRESWRIAWPEERAPALQDGGERGPCSTLVRRRDAQTE